MKPLPASSVVSQPSASVSSWSKRRGARILFSAVFLVTFTLAFLRYDWRRHTPLYLKWHQAESHLPQHNNSLSYPEGKDAKFLYFARTAKDEEAGFGNILQEALLNAFVAHESRRAYVFDHHLWSDSGGGYSSLWDKVDPIQIPFTAMLAGALVGGPMPNSDRVPRAVHSEYFDAVCPPSERTLLKGDDILPDVPHPTAKQLVDAWVSKLNHVSARCVQIDKWVFDWGIFTHADRLFGLWNDFGTSPMMTTFDYSPLIRSAYEDNRHLFDPQHYPIPTHEVGGTEGTPGLLVMHIRQGDFKKLCTKFLPKRRWGFMAYSAFPEFSDNFVPPSWDEDEELVKAAYMKHCWPTMEQMVEKVERVRQDNPGLRSIFIMTNAPREWIDEFMGQLNDQFAWDSMSTSRDLVLSLEQQYIGQVVDMMIAQHAQVFIGNGFSSLTSNVNMLRMAKGLPPDSNRFW